MRKGVRQGCILTPLSFNLYEETIFKESLSENYSGIKVNGRMKKEYLRIK